MVLDLPVGSLECLLQGRQLGLRIPSQNVAGSVVNLRAVVFDVPGTISNQAIARDAVVHLVQRLNIDTAGVRETPNHLGFYPFGQGFFLVEH